MLNHFTELLGVCFVHSQNKSTKAVTELASFQEVLVYHLDINMYRLGTNMYC